MTSRADYVRKQCGECGGFQGKYAGPSIVEMMEKELDKTRDTNVTIGLARAIAILRQPYSYLGRKPAPDFDDVVISVIQASDKRISDAARADHSL